MPTIDPTSLPHPDSLSAHADVEYTVEDVAYMQALSVVEAVPGGTISADTATGRVPSADLSDAQNAERLLMPAMPPRDWTRNEASRLANNPYSGSRASSAGPSSRRNETAELPLRNVSGRYRGRSGGTGDLQLELRIDVDGRRPTRRVSGDFYRTTGGTIAYVGSFIVTTPTLTVSATEVVIDGRGVFTFTTGSPRLQVTIPRVAEFLPPASAVAQFMTPSGVPGARYSCAFESTLFRRLEFESDFVTGVTPFQSYNTGLLSSGGPSRVLTVAAAFAEAGVEMVDTGETNEVPIAIAGSDRIWTNRELHASMENHFRLWRDEPGWRVWLLAATIHEIGSGLRGIMFDQEGSQRQGCAVFHDVIGGASNQVIRAQLRTYVHELGHCFNLYHSHQKEYMTPSQPNRMDALSWMHYPDYYQSVNGSGAGAYWSAFPFQFDDLELVHLRHAFRNDIIMGGNPFGTGAAEIDPLIFADPIEDHSGLQLTISSSASYYMGEPVVIELKLESTDLRGKRVNAQLHPNDGYVQVGICKPGGKTFVYRPFIQQCREPDLVTLDANRPAVYDSAYIGYGKDGLYFDAPGVYELRAIYHATDDSRVISNVLRLRVEAPVDNQEREIAELFLGDEQGRLLYLLGSDAEGLSDGNDAFDQMLAQYGKHPMAVYAKLAKGMNASRPFKSIDTVENRVTVRKADFKASANFLSDVVQTTITSNPNADPTADVGLDNISLNMTMRRLSEAQRAAGDVEKSRQTALAMISHFAKPGIPGFVKADVEYQVASLLQVEGDEETAEGGAHRKPKTQSPKSRG
jgi:hypothetical protein